MKTDREKQNGSIGSLSMISLLIGVLTLLSFLVLIILGQYRVHTFEQIGEYIFLSIPVTGIIGLFTGFAAFIKIREGKENPKAQKYAMMGIFVSLITLIIFLLIFWLF